MSPPRPGLHRLKRIVVFASLLAYSVSVFGDELDIKVGGVDRDASDITGAPDLITPLALVFAATRPAFAYDYARLEGVLVAPGQEGESTAQTASVTLHWNPGDRFAFRYRPSWSFYSNEAFDDNLSHDFGGRARFVFNEWGLEASHRYVKSSVPLIETGRQTSQEFHATRLVANRELGPRTSIELGLSQNLQFAESFSDSIEWATQNWLHYRFTDRISGSGGFTLGRISVDDGPDLSYEQLRLRARWQAGTKLSFDVRAGLQTRHASGGRTASPVFGGQIVYRLLETTQFTVAADKRIAPTLLQNLFTESRILRIGWQQRLLEHFHLTVQWIQRRNRYERATEDLRTVRTDRGNGWQVSLGTTIRQRGTISLGYQHAENRSSDPRFGVGASLYSIQLGFSY